MPLRFQLSRLLSRPNIADHLAWWVHSRDIDGEMNSRYATGRWRYLVQVSEQCERSCARASAVLMVTSMRVWKLRHVCYNVANRFRTCVGIVHAQRGRVREHARYALAVELFFDFVSPPDNGNVSLAVIGFTILNLPAKIRNRRENRIVSTIVACDKEPHLVLDGFLLPLVEELNAYYRGTFLQKKNTGRMLTSCLH